MSAAPGWYPDPGGQPGAYRFWDGASWSATTNADPWLASADSSLSAPAATRNPRSGARWVLVSLAVLVVLIVVTALVVRGRHQPIIDYSPVPNPGSTSDGCPEAALPSTTPPQVTGSRVRSGHLSYPRLPAPFGAPEWDSRVPFGRDVQSQQATVEQNAAGKTTWVANMLVARLLAGDGFYGLKQGAELVATCITGRFYGDAEVTRDDRRNQASTIDGHEAWLIESHLSFDLPDVATKGELMTILVVQTQVGEAGLLYASVPDTSPQFLAPTRAALTGASVDG